PPDPDRDGLRAHAVVVAVLDEAGDGAHAALDEVEERALLGGFLALERVLPDAKSRLRPQRDDRIVRHVDLGVGLRGELQHIARGKGNADGSGYLLAAAQDYDVSRREYHAPGDFLSVHRGGGRERAGERQQQYRQFHSVHLSEIVARL